MTFEEEFPMLVLNHQFPCCDDALLRYWEEEDIMKFCLDKERVRKAINDADFTADTELEREAVKMKLLKELGL